MTAPCPICGDPFPPDPSHGYWINGERESTCKACHATLMQITLESQLGMRKKFLSARSTEAIRKQVRRGVLEARGWAQPLTEERIR